MNLKTVLAGVIGLVIGVGGYYLIGLQSAKTIPQTPTEMGIQFGTDINANSLFAARSLMTGHASRQFSQIDWKSLKRWAGSGSTKGFAFQTNEVLTFPDGHTLTLWLINPIGSTNSSWQIQQITEGTSQKSGSTATLVVSHAP